MESPRGFRTPQGDSPLLSIPAISAALSGLCGVALLLLIGHAGNPRVDPTYVPIFAGGYPTILQALDPAAYAPRARLTLTFRGVLAALSLLKIAATAFTLGGGGSGGIFAPSLFIGATAGGAIGLGLHHFSAAEEPSTYALVGMGAILAAIIQAPLMGIILLFELTRNYQVMLPIMIAAVSATMLYRARCSARASILQLRQMGVTVPGLRGRRRGPAPHRRRSIAPQARARGPSRRAALRSSAKNAARKLQRTSWCLTIAPIIWEACFTALDLRTVILAPESAQLVLVVGEVMRSDVPPLGKMSDTLEGAWDLFLAL